MLAADTSTLDRLIAEVKEAEASDRNLARIRSTARPRVNVEIENPIAWVILFGYDPQRYFTDPLFNLEQNLRQALWRFRNIEDDVPIGSWVPAWLGHYVEYSFYGLRLGIREHGGPELQTDHPLTRDPDLRLLPELDFSTPEGFRAPGWMPRMLEWYERLVELADGRLDIGFFAWNRGGLDIAVQLRGFENLLTDTVERPEFVHGLLGRLTADRCAWFSAAAQYLSQPLGPTWVADDWVAAPYISPPIFRDFVLPGYLQIEAHHGVFAGFHSCGDQAPFHVDMLRIQTLGSYEVSPWMSLAQALDNLPPDKHLHLGVHPNDVVVDSPEQMRAKLQAQADLIKDSGRSYSVGTSGLTPIQPEAEFVEHVNQWVDIAREVFR
ncbi:MAG: hypothetical protein HPY69_07025 [Armatimonadetes bacterium]|nr:hypothetical protein [Armatimonadota bacterium]